MYVQEELIMQVSKWGNSLAIRLPATVVKALEVLSFQFLVLSKN
jgi:antitoxin component of MazEF toxin-antitoxin module